VTAGNKAIVRRWWEDGYNRGELSLIDSLFAESYIHHSNDNPLDREAFRTAAANFHSAFPDSLVHIERLIGEDKFVVVRWRFEGTHTVDSTRWGPASGVKLSFPSTWICQVDGGLIREDWETWDASGVIERTRATGR
jgi:steroid delta-isomerase-like uncharacterized protein